MQSPPNTPATNLLSAKRHAAKCLVAGKSVRAPAISLLSDGELDTLALGEGDPGLLTADDEDVALTGGELVVDGVLDVDNVEASVVALTVGDDTDTTHVATTSSHGDHTSIEADEVGDLAWRGCQHMCLTEDRVCKSYQSTDRS